MSLFCEDDACHTVFSSRVAAAMRVSSIQNTLKDQDMQLKLKDDEIESLKKQVADLRGAVANLKPFERKSAAAKTKLDKAVELLNALRAEKLSAAAQQQAVSTSAQCKLCNECVAAQRRKSLLLLVYRTAAATKH